MERSETGEFAVHPGEHESAGNVVLRAVSPNFFRGDLRADVGVYGDERGIAAMSEALASVMKVE